MTEYTTAELGELVGIDDAPVFFMRAERDGWLVPSLAPRTGSGDPKRRERYNDEDLLVARTVLAAFPVQPGVGGRPSSRYRRRLAGLVRRWPDRRWVVMAEHRGGATDNPANVALFATKHQGEVVTIVDLDEFREPPMTDT